MKMVFKLLSSISLCFGTMHCTHAMDRRSDLDTDILKISTDTLLQLNISDSSKLIHIRKQFYKSHSGHLYQRTKAQDMGRSTSNKTFFYEYFDGSIPQYIDPLSFTELNGWFAKDRNSVFYYRPMSGGMLISKISEADSKTFKVLKGHYLFAIDKNHVYKESEIIEGFMPSKLQIILDKNGRIKELICGPNKIKAG